jgi:hypothetical protein
MDNNGGGFFWGILGGAVASLIFGCITLKLKVDIHNTVSDEKEKENELLKLSEEKGSN